MQKEGGKEKQIVIYLRVKQRVWHLGVVIGDVVTGKSSSPAAVEGEGKLMFPANLWAGNELRW